MKGMVDIMIALGNDHGGYKLKEEIKKYLEEVGIEYKDFGSFSEERTDYPIYASKVAKAVSNKECEKGILICRSGHGMTIVANKFKFVRAANIQSEEESRRAKADDNVNIIALSGDNMEINEAVRVIRTWLATPFKGGRYQERIDMVEKIEKENMK